MSNGRMQLSLHMKGTSEVLQATLSLNKNIHTQLYHGLTKPLSRMDSDDLLYLSLC